jgi:hypothetical protein
VGYRSHWRLAFKGDASALILLRVWLKLRADTDTGEVQPVLGYTYQSTYQSIYSSRKPLRSGLLEFEDDYTKCYSPWDDVILTIREKAAELGLQSAYARVGEDSNDNEQSCSDDGTLYIPVCVSLGETESQMTFDKILQGVMFVAMLINVVLGLLTSDSALVAVGALGIYITHRDMSLDREVEELNEGTESKCIWCGRHDS